MTNPDVLLLDEVSLGLSPLAVDRVYASLQTLLTSGTTIVLVEQDLTRALRVAGRVDLHAGGRRRSRGAAGELTREEVTEAYFGLDKASRRGGAMIWLNQIIQGVLLGGYYALIACGLSFMFSVMRIINLAHGSLADPGGVRAFRARRPFRRVAVPRACWSSCRRWRRSAGRCSGSCWSAARAPGCWCRCSARSACRSSSTICCSSGSAPTRARSRPISTIFSYDSWSLTDDIDDRQARRADFVTAVVLLGGLQLFLSRTPLGRAIRATAEDPDTVGLVGINARLVNAIAAAIAMATVGLAGAALAMRATFDPYAGAPQLIFAFEAAVIGGAGSLWGTLIGGIVLGRRAEPRRADQSAGLLHRRPRDIPRCAVRAPDTGRRRRRLFLASLRGRA